MAWLALAFGSAHAADLHGLVVRVADGDTLTVRTAPATTQAIRLEGIDAPELKQPHGPASRASLAALALHREADLQCSKTDRYGRQVCRVLVGGVDVNAEQLRRGMAWHFTRYAHEQPAPRRVADAQAQDEARRAHRGLFAQPDPQPPWAYREARRASRAQGTP